MIRLYRWILSHWPLVTRRRFERREGMWVQMSRRQDEANTALGKRARTAELELKRWQDAAKADMARPLRVGERVNVQGQVWTVDKIKPHAGRLELVGWVKKAAPTPA